MCSLQWGAPTQVRGAGGVPRDLAPRPETSKGTFVSYESRAAFAGQIAEVSVLELLHTILQGAHTGLARFETPVGAAMLWFREGALVDADMGRHHMEAAVQRLLALESGTFEVEFKPVSRRQVITATTAEMIATAPPRPAPAIANTPAPQPAQVRSTMLAAGPTPPPVSPMPVAAPPPGAPVAVPHDEGDMSRRRARRAGVSWHPTGGGRPADVVVPSPVQRPGGTSTPTPAAAHGATSVAREDGPAATPPSARGTPSTPARVGMPAAIPPPPPPPPARPHVGAAPRPSVPTATGIPIPTAHDASVSSPAPEAIASPRRTVFGVPGVAAPTERISPAPADFSEDDRTVMRAGPLAPMFVPPPQPSEAPSGTPLHLEPRPAQWGTGTGTMRAVTDAPIDPRLAGGTVDVPPSMPPPISPMAARPRSTTPMPALPRAAPSTTAPRSPAISATAPSPTAPSTTAPSTTAPSPTAPSPTAPSTAAIESGRRPTASGEFQPAGDLPAMAPGWTPVAPRSPNTGETVVVRPELNPSQTMTAGSIRRATPALPSRPAGARRPEERAALVAGAIGMGIPSADRRTVSDGARLDQQVEAAGAAGLTGASAPAVVGRYEVLLRIARGGMGTVYLARVTGEGGFRRLFALKVVRDHLSQNDDYVRMLLQEARIASRLHHPNVVGIVDIGTLANQHYLVMDYVEGCTFSELLKVHRRTRPPHLVVPIVLDALMGLHAAHTLVDDDGSPLTLVHCDFSPQNMLVGTNGVCRITDFGIAKATNVINERPSITRGKPAYVSPEQVTGRSLDHRSDIFSAGVVLWNALTGEQLFSGETPELTLHSVLQRQVLPPSTVGLRPPSCFDRVCLRALERDPNRRYQTAEEMLIDLRRIAIAEDFLAPSSDVGRWVSETFGRQLELRRQAAGISRGLGADSQPMCIAVPELGIGDGELTAETRTLPSDYSTAMPESNASNTALLRSDVMPVVTAPGAAPEVEPPGIGKAIVVVAAVAVATIAIAIAILRPEWIQGGSIDEYGRYKSNAGEAAATDADEPAVVETGGPHADGAAGDTKAEAAGADPDAKADAELEPGAPAPSGEAAPPVEGGVAVPPTTHVNEPAPTATPKAPLAEPKPKKPAAEPKPKKPKPEPKPKKPKLEPKTPPPGDDDATDDPPSEPAPREVPPAPDPSDVPPPPDPGEVLDRPPQ